MAKPDHSKQGRMKGRKKERKGGGKEGGSEAGRERGSNSFMLYIIILCELCRYF